MSSRELARLFFVSCFVPRGKINYQEAKSERTHLSCPVPELCITESPTRLQIIDRIKDLNAQFPSQELHQHTFLLLIVPLWSLVERAAV